MRRYFDFLYNKWVECRGDHEIARKVNPQFPHLYDATVYQIIDSNGWFWKVLLNCDTLITGDRAFFRPRWAMNECERWLTGRRKYQEASDGIFTPVFDKLNEDDSDAGKEMHEMP